MYDVFYNIRQTSLEYLQLHYMDTDSFVLSFSKSNATNEHMAHLRCLDFAIISNNKVPGIFKHDLGSRTIEEFITLSPKTYSFKNYLKVKEI